MKNRKQTEQGQAIILLVLGIITLLGFTALAIDGGRTYSEKRTIQGVSDTSSMTGALYLGKLGLAVDESAKAEAVNASLARAASNGYDNDSADASVTVEVFEEPQYYVVETNITSTIQPVFAQVVFGGDLTVHAKSIARVLKIKNFALGQAFYAKSTDACQAFSQGGNSTLVIENNGIFSNSATTCPSGAVNIGGTASFGGEIISAVGAIVAAPGSILPPPPVFESAEQQELPELPTPDCSAMNGVPLPDENDSGYPDPSGVFDKILKPGNYTKMQLNPGNYFLEPGLYCLTGDFSATSENTTVTGDDVMFYLQGNAGFSNQGGNLYLTAPQNNAWQDGAPMYWNGMLIYQAYGNTDDLVINGNTDSYLEGTIFVPDADCTFSGTEETVSQDIQVICNTIAVSGTSELRINYNDDNKYIPPFIIDLVE